MTTLPITQDRITSQVLLAVWQHGPLLLEQIHERVPEAGGLGAGSPLIRHALIQLGAEGLVYLDDGPVDPLYGAGGMDENWAKKRYGELSGDRACMLCGCTDVWGCEEGCTWIAAEVCSSCGMLVPRPLGIGEFVKVSGPEVELRRQIDGVYGMIVDGAEPTVVTEDTRNIWVVYLYGAEQDIATFAEDALTWVPSAEALA